MITTMLDTATIFRREFVARRDLLWAGVAAALLILILPYLPGLSNLDHGDVRSAAALGFALGAGIVLSIGLGASLFGRDLSESRLGFFFERPVKTTAVWLGRFAAVYLLVILCEAVILVAGGAWLKESALLELSMVEAVRNAGPYGTPDWPFWFLAGPVFLLLGSHSLSIMLRARSVWLAVDLAGTMFAGIAAWLALRPLVDGGFDRAVEVVGSGIVASVLLALLAGTAIGLAQGRTDLRRTHRFLSTTLWGVLALSLGGLLSYSAWLMSFGPWDSEELSVGHVSPDGSWVEVQGGARGHLDVRRQFLVSTDGQRSISLPAVTDRLRSWRIRSSVRVSSDGSRAVWVKAQGEDRPSTLWYVDLQSSRLEPVATTITLPTDPNLEISPDGATVAFLEDRTLSVLDLEEERLLTAVRMKDDDRHLLFRYTNPTNLRLLTISYEEVGDYEWDRSLCFSDLAAERGAKPLTRNTVHEPHGQYVRIDRGLEYVVPGFDNSWHLRRALHLPQKIFNAASGAFEREVKGLFGGFLPANRFWSVYVTDGKSARLVVDSLRGEGQADEFDLGTIRYSIVVGGGIDGTVFIASDMEFWGGPHKFAWKDIEILNLQSGEKRPLGEELAIVGLWEERVEFPDGVRTTIFATSSSTALFRDQRGALLVYDSHVNKMKPVAGGHQE